jgi:hypothetical protein
MALKGDKQRMIEIGPEEMWTPFLDEVNNLLHEEKALRHENDHIKLAEVCTRIVSDLLLFLSMTSKNLVILIALTGL